jgi:sugar phosphate isomerase/epimerase
MEEPTAFAEAYAPLVVTTHFKDMAVKEYEDGFLLSEVPLGEGYLDLARIKAVCEKANPKVQFNLEMITRDPLKIPCLTDKYWATMRDVSGWHLAKTLAMVRREEHSEALPAVRGLGPAERLALEEEHVRRSFEYARRELGL